MLRTNFNLNVRPYDPYTSIILYEVKPGDSVSAVLRRLFGEVSSEILQLRLSAVTRLNSHIENLNFIFPGQLLFIPIFQNDGNSFFQERIDSPEYVQELWGKARPETKRFLTKYWDQIDFLSDGLSRFDDLVLKSGPQVAPELMSLSTAMSTKVENIVTLRSKHMMRVLIEQRKEATRFVIQHLQQISAESVVVVHFNPGRFYSIAKKVETLLSTAEKFHLGKALFLADLTLSGAEVVKEYQETEDLKKTGIKAAEQAMKIGGGAGGAYLGSQVCGIAIAFGTGGGATALGIGAVPGFIGGSLVCGGAIILGTISGSALGKMFGRFSASWVADNFFSSTTSIQEVPMKAINQ